MRGTRTIAISAKRHDGNIESAVDEMKNDYLGSELTAEFMGVSDTLQTGIVLRYPEELTEVTDDALTYRLVHTKAIEYCVVTADKDGNFPKEGYAKGSLSDIATAIHIGASPTKKIEAVAKVYNKGMKSGQSALSVRLKIVLLLAKCLARLSARMPMSRLAKPPAMFIIDAFISKMLSQAKRRSKRCFRSSITTTEQNRQT